MKIFLFSFLFISTSLFGQLELKPPPFAPRLPFESEVISLPRTDGDFSIYFTYKIPYKLLVFEKEEELYNAGFRVIVEISDKDGNLVARDIKDSKVTVNNFEKFICCSGDKDKTNDNKSSVLPKEKDLS